MSEAEDPKDWRHEVLAAVESVAHRSSQEQEALLEQLRDVVLREHPRREAIIRDLRDYLQVVRRRDDARTAEAYAAERLEAHVFAQLEDLLEGRSSLPDGVSQRYRFIAEIAILGHLFKHLGERLQRQDAQDWLSASLKELRCPGVKGQPSD